MSFFSRPTILRRAFWSTSTPPGGGLGAAAGWTAMLLWMLMPYRKPSWFPDWLPPHIPCAVRDWGGGAIPNGARLIDRASRTAGATGVAYELIDAFAVCFCEMYANGLEGPVVSCGVAIEVLDSSWAACSHGERQRRGFLRHGAERARTAFENSQRIWLAKSASNVLRKKATSPVPGIMTSPSASLKPRPS